MKTIGLMPITGSAPVGGGQGVAKSDPTGFGDVLKGAVDAVSNAQKESAALTTGLVSGQHSNIHETMIAMEKSSLSLRMLAKVQTKVVDAYKEVMRIQL